jgi:predicted enzyme related to lactoylglutathione lyase
MATNARLVSLFPVKKMKRALRFYTEQLGGTLKAGGEGEMKDWWASLDLAGSEVWLVTPEKREKHKLAYHSFIVKDIRKFVRDLQKNGVKFEKAMGGKGAKTEGPITFDPIGANAFFKDTEGNLLMAFQDGASG